MVSATAIKNLMKNIIILANPISLPIHVHDRNMCGKTYSQKTHIQKKHKKSGGERNVNLPAVKCIQSLIINLYHSPRLWP